MRVCVSTYAYFDKRRRGEGLRIGCARYLVRGVKKNSYARRNIFDVWMPTVAPSRELVAWARQRDFEDPKAWDIYSRRYAHEMKTSNSRQTIRVLAMVAKRTPISLGCYCRGKYCHRFILERLIRAAAAGKF
jgi:uncharacterized protein YeaO (DUF488 family)